MITIYGASDDLVEVDGCEGADEFNVFSHGNFQAVAWHGDFVAPSGGAIPEQLRVYAIYDGCWHFSVGQVLEDVPLPPWPIAFRQGHGMTEAVRRGEAGYESAHSVVLTIDAPAGTRLDNIWPAPDDDDA